MKNPVHYHHEAGLFDGSIIGEGEKVVPARAHGVHLDEYGAATRRLDARLTSMKMFDNRLLPAYR